MDRFKSFISKIVIVFAMVLIAGVLGSSNVYAKNAEVLMHMDNDFKDTAGHSIESHGKVSIDNSIYKVGNGSANFPGYTKDDFLELVNNNGDFNFEGDYTIDFWFNLTTIKNDQYFTDLKGTGNRLAIEYWDGGFRYVVNTDAVLPKTQYALKTNTWYHMAVVRSGSNMYMFINGKLLSTGTSPITHGSATENIMLGTYPGTTNVSINGHIDEFRISNGTARWTSDFTPPTVPSSDISEITLNKSIDNLKVGQTDQLTATNKIVTWKSSDESIATVDSTGKVTAVKEGTATITATTTDGSNLSASCTVNVKPKDTTPTNPTQPTDNTGNAILTITMTNGNVKSYTVSMTKVNDFISWYDNRVSGSTGKAYYTFDKTDNLQPFSKKTEFLVFDKISSYEVDEYRK